MAVSGGHDPLAPFEARSVFKTAPVRLPGTTHLMMLPPVHPWSAATAIFRR